MHWFNLKQNKRIWRLQFISFMEDSLRFISDLTKAGTSVPAFHQAESSGEFSVWELL